MKSKIAVIDLDQFYPGLITPDKHQCNQPSISIFRSKTQQMIAKLLSIRRKNNKCQT